MTSDVAMNLPSAPSTPTTSVTSISDLTSTFEAVSMGSVSEQDSSRRTFTRRPRFSFDKQLIVNVRVQGVEFSIPEVFLTRDSDYFVQKLKAKHLSCIDIQDPDVTSSAFESLLSLIFPPEFGVVPVVELREWIDVLHLANKWNYTSIRSAALNAIQPLASCVDKIVLAREYKLNDWLPSAIRELVTRTEGLTLAEGHRLGMGVVIAIGEARANAKVAQTPQNMENLVDVLCSTLATGQPPPTDSVAIEDGLEAEACINSAQPAVSASVEDVINDQDQRRLNDWAINALEGKVAGQKRLVKHVEDHPSHVAAVVSAVLNSLWEDMKKCLQSNEMDYRLDSISYSCSIPSTLAMLRTCTSAPVFDAQVKDFCLQRINSWQGVGGIIDVQPNTFASALRVQDSYYNTSLDLCRLDFNHFGFPNNYIDMITTGRAVRYLLNDKVVDQSVFSKAVFAGFWDELLRLLHNLWEKNTLHIANAIRVTLILMRRCASTNHACKEIEEFYEEVKEKANVGDSPAVRCLKSILEERHWADD